VKAQRGDLIARGRRIGIAGCTGWCTGTHLHFEIRRGQRTLNPMKLLRR
jgi:murein DD-endopeptidase MepM/ murein hydrolase activator NlpD